MLNSKLYNPDTVWAFVQELFELTNPKGPTFPNDWSFSKLCEKHGLHQVYGTVIRQETRWLSGDKWNESVPPPSKNWISQLIDKTQKYSERAQARHTDKVLRGEQQAAFNEAVMEIACGGAGIRPEDIDAQLTELCDEFVIFKEAK